MAVAALEQPTSHHAVLDVGGPEALSPLEVVRIFEAAGAAEMRVEHVAENELREQMRTATDPLQQSFAGLMLQCAAGDGRASASWTCGGSNRGPRT